MAGNDFEEWIIVMAGLYFHMLPAGSVALAAARCIRCMVSTSGSSRPHNNQALNMTTSSHLCLGYGIHFLRHSYR